MGEQGGRGVGFRKYLCFGEIEGDGEITALLSDHVVVAFEGVFQLPAAAAD